MVGGKIHKTSVFPGRCRFSSLFVFFSVDDGYMSCQMEFIFIFFSEFRKRRFRKKNAGQTFLARGSKVFFPLLGWDFRQPKTSEVLLADAVFGHSHFCDASETWIFH